MKRQQFEDLLFVDRKMTTKEKQAMQQYVLAHPEAASLQSNWNAVQNQLAKPVQMAPQAGFTARWRAVQQADQQRKVRQQAFWALLFSALAAASMAYLAIGSEQALLLYVKDLSISAIHQLLEMSAFFQIVFRVAFSILQKFPPAWWASIATALFLLPLLYFVVYRELVTIKGVQQ